MSTDQPGDFQDTTERIEIPPLVGEADLEARAIAALGTWLESLPDDVRSFMSVVSADEMAVEVKRPLVSGLNYLVKSLDLIDDGIEGLGYLDDAFVLRLSAARAAAAGEAPEPVRTLAQDAPLIGDVLGALTPKLEAFVDSLGGVVVRGRSTADLLEDQGLREEWLAELSGWANRYRVPHFVLDEHALVKLRSFLAAKLS